jgi:uncharacterized membrane protein YkoI
MKKYLITLMTATGLLVGCNPSVEKASADFNSLPRQVQKAVRAQAPDAQVASINHRTDNGRDIYDIDLKRGDQTSKMTVAADGTVLNSDFAKTPGTLEKVLAPTGATGTKLSALPEKAQRTIKNSAPDAAIADIKRTEENGRVIYVVEFQEKGKNPTIRVAEDGQLVQDLQK